MAEDDDWVAAPPTRYAARPLSRGWASGPVVALRAPLSFWGGVDHAGVVVDAHHPDRGRALAGSVLVLPGGRGSSSSSSVLAELIRSGAGPLAIVLGRPDPIIALGALVADELYGIAVPVVAVAGPALARIGRARRARVRSEPDGQGQLVLD